MHGWEYQACRTCKDDTRYTRQRKWAACWYAVCTATWAHLRVAIEADDAAEAAQGRVKLKEREEEVGAVC